MAVGPQMDEFDSAWAEFAKEDEIPDEKFLDMPDAGSGKLEHAQDLMASLGL